MYTNTKIRSLPGIKRDGTRLEGDHYIDGQWCRFQRGLPRKMGGYLSISQNLPEKVYGIHSFSANARQYIHLGSESELNQRVVNNSGAVTGENDRTPAGLVASANNIWQFDALFEVNAGGTVLVAHAAPNMDIDQTTDFDIFSGLITDSAILTTSGQDPVSGGVLVVGNYLVGFGSGGYVQWSDQNDLSSTLDAGNFTQQKIIAGRRIRGGGIPAAVLWSLDSLLLMTFNPNPAVSSPIFDFDTLTDDTSILASRGIMEYDGVFYWAGVDRFLMYNGVVREVPNQFNVNFFYDNLNFEQRQKVFAYKVPRFGEIWWCYPHGDATECNRAVVLNVREGYWYDTVLPDEGRTDGLYAKVYFKPFMTGAEEDGGEFDLWQHETGMDRVRGGDTQPIPSHFETAEISLATQDNAVDKALSVAVIEPDFVQSGDLELTIRGRANSRTSIRDSSQKTIPESASTPDEQIVRLKEHRRLMSFKFGSNTLGGDYQAGESLAHIQPDDGRITE